MIRAALVILCLSAPVGADPAREAARLVEAVGPGAVAAVWSADGTEVAVAGLRRQGGDPVAVQDAWHVGSLGKAMTATLAARLVQDGAIAWDARIGALLPDADPVWADVTLEDLLRHRSGMAANLPIWRAVTRPGRGAYVDHMLSSRPEAERGAFLYSNAGYVVAGAMLEAAGGATWEELIARHVFAPLDMDGVGFGAPPDIWGHDPRPVPPGWRADNLPAMGPAGAVNLPPAAMMRFLAAHAARDPAFLAPEAWDMLHRPVADYAMGWRRSADGLSHAGSNTFWFARMWIGEGRAAFVAVNSGTDAARAATKAALAELP